MRKNLIWTLKQLHLSLEQYGKILLEDMELSPTQCILLHYLLSRRGQDIYGADLLATLAKASVSSTLKALRQGYLRMKEDPLDDGKKQIILMEKAYGAEQLIHTSLLAQQKRLYQEIPAMAGGGPGSNAL
ncbi:hypothetical protein KP626_04125 [Christensenella sp. MSJ-20]|uniref:hypothetical protein n=1 Tax=Christensenella sp. MSJ-20 TaxID=2841518 RepID=UPI001C7655F8|nr:hypothetical protein KP626_04125 [Christensenella sp. MSJ-20]